MRAIGRDFLVAVTHTREMQRWWASIAITPHLHRWSTLGCFGLGWGTPWENRPPASALSIAVVVEGDAFHWSVGELSLWRVAIRSTQCEQNLAWAQAMHGDMCR